METAPRAPSVRGRPEAIIATLVAQNKGQPDKYVSKKTGNGLVPGMLLHGGSLDVVPVSFQNPHSVYAYWCMSPNVKQIQREEFFVKVWHG